MVKYHVSFVVKSLKLIALKKEQNLILKSLVQVMYLAKLNRKIKKSLRPQIFTEPSVGESNSQSQVQVKSSKTFDLNLNLFIILKDVNNIDIICTQ